MSPPSLSSLFLSFKASKLFFFILNLPKIRGIKPQNTQIVEKYYIFLNKITL